MNNLIPIIRKTWHNNEWFFSVVDIVRVLTESNNPRNYWNMLKSRESENGIELSTNCVQLKLIAEDDKLRETDCTNTEGAFRIIQSIPSPKAEPLKLWLARVGYERIEEIHNPELAFNRAIKTYLQKGYPAEWVNQRIKTIEIRKELTDEWKKAGIKDESEYAILTDEITKAWSGKNILEYKNLKSLKNESLRDNMSNMEMVLNMLAEVTTTEISKKESPSNFDESKKIAVKGGEIAGNTRKNIEKELGKKVITLEKKKIKP